MFIFEKNIIIVFKNFIISLLKIFSIKIKEYLIKNIKKSFNFSFIKIFVYINNVNFIYFRFKYNRGFIYQKI